VTSISSTEYTLMDRFSATIYDGRDYRCRCSSCVPRHRFSSERATRTAIRRTAAPRTANGTSLENARPITDTRPSRLLHCVASPTHPSTAVLSRVSIERKLRIQRTQPKTLAYFLGPRCPELGPSTGNPRNDKCTNQA